MQVDFSVREDGQIDAELAGDWPVFNEALSDSISSLPPRGEPGRGPSTYWIDVAARGARLASERGDERPFTWGNSTRLRVKGGRVLASFDYDDPSDDDEAIGLKDFLALLAAWRERVVAAPSRTEFPETYRRNPMNTSPPERRWTAPATSGILPVVTSSFETTGTPQWSATRLIAVVTVALLGQFVATVAGLGTFGIAQPGHHLSETPGRDIIGGFVWIVLPGLAVIAGTEVARRLGHKVAASVVVGTGWLASMVACFEVWSHRGLECPSANGGPTCPGRSFVAVGVISAVVGLTILAGALHWAGRHRETATAAKE